MGTETFVPLNLVAELNGVLALKQILECTVVILLNCIIVIMRSSYFERGTCNKMFVVHQGSALAGCC